MNIIIGIFTFISVICFLLMFGEKEQTNKNNAALAFCVTVVAVVALCLFG